MKLSVAILPALFGIAHSFTAVKPISAGRFSSLFSTRNLETPRMNRPKTNSPVFDEVCETTGVTLTRFMVEVAILNPDLRELATLFGAVETACKAIANLVKRSQLPSSETLGYQGIVNVQGEDQKKLDAITNDVLKRALRFTGRIGVLASEEEDAPVDVVGALSSDAREVVIDESERYVCVFDPLDGSSNIDAGIPTGTILGIYEHDESCSVVDYSSDEECTEKEAQCLSNTLQPGTNLVAAAYCLYSSSTFFVLTLGDGVYMFVLDEQIGEFVLSKPNVRIPEVSSILSFNEANFERWDPPMRETVTKWREGAGSSGKKFSSRYIGSMVGDVHRTLMYGGVFGYPSDTHNPHGKLRLLYEAAPMSFIVEQAGGMSTTGTQRVMDVMPTVVHQRVPVIMGSRQDVEEVIEAYSKWRHQFLE
ncbi:fructose 1-6-bisphosphate 1-phosphatase [Fragilaria crotonensis]|nr:fructose 1-6-bisphosphate 1-phosphatase [Fragilaria crotonensis]